MNEYIKLIAENGVLLVIAAVFIWDKVTNAKTVTSILSDMQSSAKLQENTLINLHRALESLGHATENTTTALNIIQNTLANNMHSLERHDKRAEFMNSDLREVVTMLKTRPCVSRGEGRCETIAAPVENR